MLADAASSICRAGAEYSQGTEHDQPPEPLPNDSCSRASSDATRPQVYEDSGVQKYVYADPESPTSIVASSQRDETPNGNISPALCDDGQPMTMSGTCEDAQPTGILNRLRVREQSFQNNATSAEQLESLHENEATKSWNDEGVQIDIDLAPDGADTDVTSESGCSNVEENEEGETDAYDQPSSPASYARSFLERRWSGGCDCSHEHAMRSDGDTVYRLNEMSDYWQRLGVPDSIASLSASHGNKVAADPNKDWYSILAGGDQRPHLSFEKSEQSVPGIHRTWDSDSFMLSLHAYRSTEDCISPTFHQH